MKHKEMVMSFSAELSDIIRKTLNEKGIVGASVASSVLDTYGVRAGEKAMATRIEFVITVTVPETKEEAPEEITAEPGYRIVTLEDQKRCEFPNDCKVRFTVHNDNWITICRWGDVADGIHSAIAVPENYVFAEDRPKDRWLFHIPSKTVYSHPWNDQMKSSDWIEITAEQKAYIETKQRR